MFVFGYEVTPVGALAVAGAFGTGMVITFGFALLGGLKNRKEAARLQDEIDVLRQRVAEQTAHARVLETERGHLKLQLEDRLALLQQSRDGETAIRDHALGLERSLAEARVGLEKEREAHAEKVQELSNVRQGIEERLKNLANDLLKENTDGFMKHAQAYFEGQTKSSKESVENLVKPIGEALKAYQEKIGQMEQARKRDEGEIVQQLRQVAETHSKLKDTTTTLVNALRSAPKTRGRWGEQQLRTVLEMAGMLEYVDFLTEHSVDHEDKKLRPDVVLRLPGGRRVVVDAKTPMSAYLDAVEATDDETREAKLALHVQQMRAHAQQLGSKAYWDALEDAPDFVVMFVPGDNLYSAAIERDPDLFEFAYDRQVIVATPTTFLALTKAIAFGWRQEKASQNAQKVLVEGTELYKRLQTLGGKVLKLTKSIDKTVEHHNELVASLETRVMPQGRKLHELGVGSSAGELAELTQVEKAPRAPLPGKDLDLALETPNANS